MAALLPIDLERYIFEISALTCPTSIPKLCWRVQRWLEPLLYHTLVINADAIDGTPPCSVEIFNDIIRTKPVSFLRNLMIQRVPEDVTEGTGVENLYLLLRGHHYFVFDELRHPTVYR
ncbi:hypothetical protein DFH07DRAFT_948434 [Mycena maculata]|uniref:Uncharacterized protein n=1 Tax=Mycena maculata TaxID=230809 RepID=A0AAD7P2X4_9AGAR|nr:hypothetical protein DFH07DRAFT_948434 [Mycena maculata]